jgi:hypothetical protein
VDAARMNVQNSTNLESLQNIENLKDNLQEKLKSLLNKKDEVNPVVQASHIWMILSDQLCDVLGHEVHRQWFAPIRAIVVMDKMLVLKTETRFAAYWISNHYQKLVDTLLQVQDKNLNCFFIPPQDN